MTLQTRLQAVRAEDIMTRFAITVTEDQTIVDLANLFIRFNISGTPVVNDEDQLTGIVTSTNLFDYMKTIFDSINNEEQFQYDCTLSVKDIMTRDVVSIDIETSLYDMIKLMYDQHIHTFPVVREGKMVGVVGRKDVMNACYTTLCCTQK